MPDLHELFLKAQADEAESGNVVEYDDAGRMVFTMTEVKRELEG